MFECVLNSLPYNREKECGYLYSGGLNIVPCPSDPFPGWQEKSKVSTNGFQSLYFVAYTSCLSGETLSTLSSSQFLHGLMILSMNSDQQYCINYSSKKTAFTTTYQRCLLRQEPHFTLFMNQFLWIGTMYVVVVGYTSSLLQIQISIAESRQTLDQDRTSANVDLIIVLIFL